MSHELRIIWTQSVRHCCMFNFAEVERGGFGGCVDFAVPTRSPSGSWTCGGCAGHIALRHNADFDDAGRVSMEVFRTGSVEEEVATCAKSVRALLSLTHLFHFSTTAHLDHAVIDSFNR